MRRCGASPPNPVTTFRYGLDPVTTFRYGLNPVTAFRYGLNPVTTFHSSSPEPGRRLGLRVLARTRPVELQVEPTVTNLNSNLEDPHWQIYRSALADPPLCASAQR